MGAIEESFASHIAQLSETEKYVFYYIDEHPSTVREMTLSELATKLSTSNTTVIRMTKKLGLSGYSEFKYMAERITSRTQFIPQQDLLAQFRFYFERLFDSVNLEKLEQMAKKIRLAPTVYIVGVGLTKPIAEYIAKRFLQLNKSTLYTYEYHIIELIPTFTKPNDIILFLSMSGETHTIIQAARKMRYIDNVALFAITNNGQSSLAKMMDISLSSDIPTNVYENYDITSRSFIMVQADLLIETYLSLFFKDLTNRRPQLPD
ncbi:MurR/RpiR family transcriptional regulator [Lacticaseibacillus absianus]|uniref:MurR/RpiR family transcriptional regulator n=1 Tax=Lacticaseibacillus absianus TaxID=2729623 RepID=UPI0015C9B498|nr:MurR/RpiR family transcriptional regulator [Lacticaseibacillus absianus]